MWEGLVLELPMQKPAILPSALARCHTPPGTKPGPSGGTAFYHSRRERTEQRTQRYAALG